MNKKNKSVECARSLVRLIRVHGEGDVERTDFATLHFTTSPPILVPVGWVCANDTHFVDFAWITKKKVRAKRRGGKGGDLE